MKWFNIEIWILIHVPIMFLIPILSIIAFLIILSDLKWKWVDQTNTNSFVHSILGICTIIFSIIQVIISL
jgi:hypothetical protein